MRRTWLGFLLPLTLYAPDQDRARHPRSVALPVATIVPPDTNRPDLTVILTKDGRIFLEEGAVPIDLKLLGDALAATATACHKEKRDGIDVSSAVVSLRADKDASWQHVQWILLLCAQNRIHRTKFVVREACGKEGRIQAKLSPAAVPAPKNPPEPPAEAERTVISVGAHESAPARDRGGKAKEVLFRVGNRKSTDRREMALWVQESVAAATKAGAVVEGEVDGGSGVAFGEIVAVLDTLRANGIESPLLKATTKAPGADVRQVIPLPQPAKDRDEPE